MRRQMAFDDVMSTYVERNTASIPALHLRLRDATKDVHNRLHEHEGFRAVADGTIDKASYVQLLCRLYGFYKPFEHQADWGNARTTWLAQDLSDLGLATNKVLAISVCKDIPFLGLPNQRLGAGYVVSGSALGGRQLARGLDHLLAAKSVSGRRFFLGYGPKTGVIWKDFLTTIGGAPNDQQTRSTIINAACETFSVFERWLSGWKE